MPPPNTKNNQILQGHKFPRCTKNQKPLQPQQVLILAAMPQHGTTNLKHQTLTHQQMAPLRMRLRFPVLPIPIHKQ